MNKNKTELIKIIDDHIERLVNYEEDLDNVVFFNEVLVKVTNERELSFGEYEALCQIVEEATYLETDNK